MWVVFFDRSALTVDMRVSTSDFLDPVDLNLDNFSDQLIVIQSRDQFFHSGIFECEQVLICFFGMLKIGIIAYEGINRPDGKNGAAIKPETIATMTAL